MEATVDNLLLAKCRAMTIECIHRDIEDLNDNLNDEPDDADWLKDLAMARYVLKKLHHSKCQASWFSPKEVDYIVATVEYWKD